jgi:hypothetical protein
MWSHITREFDQSADGERQMTAKAGACGRGPFMESHTPAYREDEAAQIWGYRTQRIRYRPSTESSR